MSEKDTIYIEFDDPSVTAELRKNRLTLVFGNSDDAEKFFIGISEASRLKARISFGLVRAGEEKPA